MTPHPTRSTDYDIHEPTVGMTFALSPTLTGSAQAGYFWTKPKTGSEKDGFSYKGELANIDPRTTYQTERCRAATRKTFSPPKTSDSTGITV